MKNIFNKKYLFVVLLLLFISIGYAFLSSTLSISGIGHVKKSKWDVHFENVDVIEGKSLATVAPTTSGRTTTELRYSVKFNSLGDIYKFNVDIVNLGTMNAMVSLIGNTELTEEQQKYAEYSITYEDGSPIEEKNFLASNSRDRITVTLKYKDDMEIEDLELAVPIDFTLNLEYSLAKEADSRKNTSMIVKDLSGNGNDGIIYGGTYNSDGSFTSDGKNDLIHCGLANYNFGSSASIILRLKIHKFLYSSYLMGNWQFAGIGFYSLNDRLLFDVHDGEGWNSVISNSNINLNEWYTLVGIFNNKSLKFYINGNEQKGTIEGELHSSIGSLTSETVNPNIKVSTAPFGIGVNIAPGIRIANDGGFSNITISSALVFDRALTDEEVTSDYAEEINPTNKDNLLFYYNFS